MVKKSIRKDKRDYIDSLAKQAVETAGKGNMKELYMTTKKLSNNFQQAHKPIQYKNGNTLTTTEDQLKGWVEHFEDLLNRSEPELPPDIPPADTDLSINCDRPSNAEIKRAIGTLKMEKQQDLMTSQLKPSKPIQRLLSTCCMTSSIRSGRMKLFPWNGKKGS